MIEELPYVHELVELEGIGEVHCWAAVFVHSSGSVYMGNVQMDSIGPMYSGIDLETGVRTQRRRQFVEADEVTLREALLAKVRKVLSP